MMSTIPVSVRAIRDAGHFEIAWADKGAFQFPFHHLRCECPCAACVNEFTGERILDPATVPRNVIPSEVEFAGNYALKIHWSDGHNTGLYTWEQLLRLTEATEVEHVNSGN